MKLSRRTNTIILWLISIGLLVSMVIAFTPTINGLFGSNTANTDNATALRVNGQEVSELDVARAEQNIPFRSGLTGTAAEDVDLLIADGLISNAVLRDAAEDIRVSNGEVRTALNEWRRENGYGGSSNDRNYINFIGRLGYTDQTFRDFWREQLKQDKYRENLTEGVEVSDAEVQAFYDLNEENYRSEERISARQIVVEDAELAEDLLAQARDGADFSDLAAENSVELADRNGALGAAAEATDPQPVGRAALPTAVANAAFALGAPGLTDVVESGGRFYIVNVEDFVEAGARPFEEVEEEVREDALEAKRSQVLEEHFEELFDSADVEVLESSELSYNDSVVATIGDYEIENSDLVRVVYSDPQVSQALTPENAELITDLFKPNYLESLIDSELAYQGAQTLDAEFIGPRAQVAQNALAYVSREAEASEEELQSYYDENEAQFTLPQSALINQIDFDTREAATAFRDALLDGADLTEAAESEGGAVSDLGTVNPGSLRAELDTAIFAGDTFDELPDAEQGVSDILVIEDEVVSEDEATDEAATDDEAPEEDIEALAEEDSDEADETADETLEDEAAEDEAVAETDVETADDVLEDITSTEDEDVADEDAVEEDAADEDEAATEEGEDPTAEDATDEAAGDAEAEIGPVTTQTFTVLVGSTTPEELRPFDEVRAQVETAVLNEKRNALQTEWLDGIRETTEVENLLASAEPELDTPAETLGDGETTQDNSLENVLEDIEETLGEDGALEDGALEDGAVEDGAVEDNVTEDGAVEETSVEDAVPEDEDTALEDGDIENSDIENSLELEPLEETVEDLEDDAPEDTTDDLDEPEEDAEDTN